MNENLIDLGLLEWITSIMFTTDCLIGTETIGSSTWSVFNAHSWTDRFVFLGISMILFQSLYRGSNIRLADIFTRWRIWSTDLCTWWKYQWWRSWWSYIRWRWNYSRYWHGIKTNWFHRTTKLVNTKHECSLSIFSISSILDQELVTSYWHRTLSDEVSPSLRDFALFW